MTPIRIDIPNAPSVAQQAGQIIIDAIREAGMDPRTAADIPMVRALVGAWGRGEMSRGEFVAAVGKVKLFNPNL